MFQIGVDELFLLDGDCPPSPWCDFETGFCGWTNDTTGNFYWTRTQKATESSGTGPSTGTRMLNESVRHPTSLPRRRSHDGN